MRALPCLLVVLAAVAFDFAVKRWVESNLELHAFVGIFPSLALYRTHNTGIAFSMLDWLEGPWLVLLPIFIIGAVIVLAMRTPVAQGFARAGFALIIGGAIGNLIDRATLGYVIDYVLFYVGDWSFAIFNLADAFITLGAGLIILQEIMNLWSRRERSL